MATYILFKTFVDIAAPYVQLALDSNERRAASHICVAFFLLAPVVLYSRIFRKSSVNTTLQTPSARIGFVALALMIGLHALAVCVAALSSLGSVVISSNGWTSNHYLTLADATSISANSLSEELTYRLILLTPLREVIPTWAGNLVQSVVFAFMHGSATSYDLWSTVYYVGFGLLMGQISLAPGGLWYATIAHATHNIIVALLIGNEYTNGIGFLVTIPPGYRESLATGFSVFYLCMLILAKRRKRARKSGVRP